MANRNGLGPFNEGPMTGRGLGNCMTGNNKTAAKVGAGLGLGLGLAWGCRKGLGRGRGMRAGRGFRMGGGRFFSPDHGTDKEALKSYRDRLKEELDLIDKKLSEADNEEVNG